MLGVIYLIFDEGYSATAGEDLLRPQLCEDALRLGRILAELTPGEPEETDWARISALYAELAEVAPSPVVELNRAVAVSMAEGPEAALAIVDGLTELASLKRYHLLPSVRGDLLAKLGREAEARAEFERAASCAS